MPITKSQQEASKRYDKVNMAYQTIKVKKSLLADFKEVCRLRGHKVNTVLRLSMESYIADYLKELNGDSAVQYYPKEWEVKYRIDRKYWGRFDNLHQYIDYLTNGIEY